MPTAIHGMQPCDTPCGCTRLDYRLLEATPALPHGMALAKIKQSECRRAGTTPSPLEGRGNVINKHSCNGWTYGITQPKEVALWRHCL